MKNPDPTLFADAIDKDEKAACGHLTVSSPTIMKTFLHRNAFQIWVNLELYKTARYGITGAPARSERRKRVEQLLPYWEKAVPWWSHPVMHEMILQFDTSDKDERAALTAMVTSKLGQKLWRNRDYSDKYGNTPQPRALTSCREATVRFAVEVGRPFSITQGYHTSGCNSHKALRDRLIAEATAVAAAVDEDLAEAAAEIAAERARA